MLLCYITDRKQFSGNEAIRRECLLDTISEAAACGTDYIQLREKDLSARQLESLSREAMVRIQSERSSTKLLINSRPDVALAVGAHGVHLRSEDISPQDVRKIYQKCDTYSQAREKLAALIIGVSCHTADEVAQAASAGATYAVLGPIFEKSGLAGTHPLGLEELKKACRYKIPVLALGGITLQNAQSCIEAGAAGIAGIRLFQGNKIAKIAAKLKN